MTDSVALRSAIKNSGLKYGALAERIGITAYSLQKKIDNRVEFKSSEIAKLADILGLTGDAFNAIFFAIDSDLKSRQ